MSPDVSGESSQTGAQFQGRPSEVWSQWQNQHHSQPAGEQHTHPNPSQTEVFQVTHTSAAEQSFIQLLAADQCIHIWPPPPVCVCRTCYPWLEIPPREQPTTTSRILLTSGCSHPSLSNPPLHSPSQNWTNVCIHLMLSIFFLCCWITNTQLSAAEWMSGCTCHSPTDKHTQSTNVWSSSPAVCICKHTHTSSLQRGTLPSDGGNISQPIEKLYLPSHWWVCLTIKVSAVSIGTARGQSGDYSRAHFRIQFFCSSDLTKQKSDFLQEFKCGSSSQIMHQVIYKTVCSVSNLHYVWFCSQKEIWHAATYRLIAPPLQFMSPTVWQGVTHGPDCFCQQSFSSFSSCFYVKFKIRWIQLMCLDSWNWNKWLQETVPKY